MIRSDQILNTVDMIQKENLDVRAVTMGINLLDYHRSVVGKTCQAIKEKIEQNAAKLVETCETISTEYAIPVVNKRIAVTPIAHVGAGFDISGFIEIAKALDEAAEAVGVDFLGGFSADVADGMTKGDRALIDAIPEALSTTKQVCASVNVGSTRSGINMDAIARLGHTIKELSENSADQDGFAAAKFVVFTNQPGDNPFMAGAVHGVEQHEVAINVGVSGPGVIARALERKIAQANGDELGLHDLADEIKRTILNDAVKKGGSFASQSVGGLSGAFIPVCEDRVLADAVRDGSLALEKLEAMTSVSSVGLDMIAIPGSVDANTIAAVIADEMVIGMINSKTTAVRLIPVPNKEAGDIVSFGGLFGGSAIAQVRNAGKSARFVNFGGKIPAPIHSLRN